MTAVEFRQHLQESDTAGRKALQTTKAMVASGAVDFRHAHDALLLAVGLVDRNVLNHAYGSAMQAVAKVQRGFSFAAVTSYEEVMSVLDLAIASLV